MYPVLEEAVTMLRKDLKWLSTPSLKQQFSWSIVASCCGKIPIDEHHFEWVLMYESVIIRLGHLYRSYCEWKKLPEDKRLLSAEEYPKEIAHANNIRKYGSTVMLKLSCYCLCICVNR